jgi:hypothetical protein
MNIRSLRRGVPYLMALLIVAVACFAVGNAVTERSSVQAQAPAAPGLAPSAVGTCTIVQLAAYDNRIHVECQANTGGIGATIVFFAAPTETPAEARVANRYMALLMEARALGLLPAISWASGSASNPPECLSTNCRLLTGVALP